MSLSYAEFEVVEKHSCPLEVTFLQDQGQSPFLILY